ncbi:MAG: Trm112 family protein [Lawsonella sp.]|nr:Trm112 family protein [Mycobacteriales bacterium]
MSNRITTELLQVLACPEDKGELLYIPDKGLYNPRLQKLYPIVNDIPVLLIDEARAVSDEEHAAFTAY